MSTDDTLDRIEALDQLFDEAVGVQVTERDDGRWDLEWTSGDETVLYANCADEDTARMLNSVPEMLHVMRLVMEEEGFMGNLPADIVDTCHDAMNTVFDESLNNP